MIEPLETEALLAAIGLQAVLDAKPTLHKYQLEAAAGIGDAITRRMTAFVGTDGFKPAVNMPPFDYREVLKQVSDGQTPAQAHALLGAIPDQEIATEIGLLANRALQWAFGVIPRQDLSGFRPEDPDKHQQANFRRIWQVACNPLAVLDDLEDGSLSDDQVAALSTLYPALYAQFREAITDALATLAARKPKSWEPNATKMALLAVLRQEPAWDPDLLQMVQAAYAQRAKADEARQQQQGQPRKSATRTSEVQESTPGQNAKAGQTE